MGKSVSWSKFAPISCTRIPNPRPCRAITSAGKEIAHLSSEESIDSSECKLSPSCDQFAGVLRNLGTDLEEKKPKRVSKKKVATARGATVKKTAVVGATSDAGSEKGLKPQRTQSAGSVGFKGPDSGTTPIVEESEDLNLDPEAEELISKNASKGSRAKTKTETTPPPPP
ncbi:hypothetical protein Hanom_Chr17g01576921 [Helianthus anomalus]